MSEETSLLTICMCSNVCLYLLHMTAQQLRQAIIPSSLTLYCFIMLKIVTTIHRQTHAPVSYIDVYLIELNLVSVICHF